MTTIFRNLQWRDILIHAAGGVAWGFIAFLVGWPWLLLSNAAFWICREALQRIQEGRPLSRLLTSNQVVFEWGAPSVLAVVIYFILGAAA